MQRKISQLYPSLKGQAGDDLKQKARRLKMRGIERYQNKKLKQGAKPNGTL
jgi:hypothetical protein